LNNRVCRTNQFDSEFQTNYFRAKDENFVIRNLSSCSFKKNLFQNLIRSHYFLLHTVDSVRTLFFFWCPSSLRIKRTETDGKRKEKGKRKKKRRTETDGWEGKIIHTFSFRADFKLSFIKKFFFEVFLIFQVSGIFLYDFLFV
jgi:hypothetical protein